MAAFVTGESLRVEGLSEMVKGLRAIDKKLPKIVARANKQLTEKIMLPEARRRWAAQDIRPSVASQVIKPSGTATAAGLRLRAATSGKFPFAAGVEFGALAFKQFRRWRGNKWTVAPGSSTGYVVQDAIRDNLNKFGKQWLNAVHREMDRTLDAAG